MKINYLLSYKKKAFTSVFLIVVVFTLQAQIPNSGFESWTTIGSYEEPNSYGSTNSACTGSFYPVTKSTDHYPASLGNYSIRLDNNTSLLPPGSYCGLGVVGTVAKFPITGHPNSFTGYYKFFPLGGDTMIISLRLFNSGVQVSIAEIKTTATAASWTPFNIPLASYAVADSATIRLSAYCTCGPTNIPHGNSVLKVDNLNFDNLLTGISEISDASNLSVYPNPFTDFITFSIIGLETHNSEIVFYDVLGNTVMKREGSLSETVVFDGSNLPPGIYFCELKTKNKQIRKKVIKYN